MKHFFGLVTCCFVLLVPSACLADAGGPVLYMTFSSLLAFGLGEAWAVLVEFVWLRAIFREVGTWRVLWWTVLVNTASTLVGCVIVLLLMPLHLKFFGVGELTRVWMAVWFALALIPAYLATIWVEMRILLHLTDTRVVIFFDSLLRAVLGMNAISFTGLALIYLLLTAVG